MLKKKNRILLCSILLTTFLLPVGVSQKVLAKTVKDSSKVTNFVSKNDCKDYKGSNSIINGNYNIKSNYLFDSFKFFNTNNWMKSNGWTNGGVFNCTWRATNVNFDKGKMVLTLDKDTQGGATPYAGGEYRSNNFYGYGLYKVNMKPANNVGVVSSFFTYTGPSDNNPWDEIDIEFLGKDTTKVQFNYYTNGVGNHEYVYNLGFDASKGFHTYAFDWQKNYIAWLVDGKEVHRVTENIPTHPGKIMMNLWNGINVDDWLGAYNGVVPIHAYYNWMFYSKTK